MVEVGNVVPLPLAVGTMMRSSPLSSVSMCPEPPFSSASKLMYQWRNEPSGVKNFQTLYTALTRQKDKVIVLHEGTLEELRDLAAPWRSETARRHLAALGPGPVQFVAAGGQGGQRPDSVDRVASNG